MSNISIGFSGKCIRIISIRDNKEINLISEIETFQTFNFDISKYSNNPSVISELAEKISTTIKQKENFVDKVALSLDSNMFFINSIPLENMQDKHNAELAILWDLKNYYNNPQLDMAVNYIPLNSSGLPPGISNILFLAINEKSLEFFKKVITAADLKIGIIDIDHFSIESILSEMNSEFFNNNNITVIGCKRNKVDISRYINGKISGYDFFYFKDNTFEKEISKEKKKICSIKPDKIFLYGEDYCEYFKNELKSELNPDKIEILNPLTQDNKQDSNDKKFNGLYHYGYRFVPVLSSALKTLTVQE